MEIEELKRELVDILEGIDKEALDLCSLKDYAEIVKVVSEIKGHDYTEIIAQMVSASPYDRSMKALGPVTIRDMKTGKKGHDHEEEEDD